MSVGCKEEEIVTSVKFTADPNNSTIISVESSRENAQLAVLYMRL